MKHILLTLTLVFSILKATSQEVSVEKSIFGIQTGLIGVWVHNEARLSNSFALRSELGLDLGYYDNSFLDESGVFVVPAITLEPRWYYNLERRAAKSRRIDGNSGNFISIKTTFNPDVMIGADEDKVNFISDFYIVPTWGIRRQLGKHFNYEAGAGLGYIHYFEEDNVISDFDSGLYLNLHARIGFRF